MLCSQVGSDDTRDAALAAVNGRAQRSPDHARRDRDRVMMCWLGDRDRACSSVLVRAAACPLLFCRSCVSEGTL